MNQGKLALQADSWYNISTVKYVALAMLEASQGMIEERSISPMEDIIPLWMQKCSRCQHIKPIEDFPPGTIKPYNRASRCRACRNEVYQLKHTKDDLSCKVCVQCKQERNIEEYHKDKYTASGYSSICKICRKAYHATNYQPQPRKRVIPIIPASKQCTYCDEVKPIEDFSPSKDAKDRHKNQCKSCANQYRAYNYVPDSRKSKHNVLKKYGLTLEQYESLAKSQNYACAACGNPETSFSRQHNVFKQLAVDHDHKTGEIRALLCGKCNAALGFLQDDPLRVESLLNYIKRFEKGEKD